MVVVVGTVVVDVLGRLVVVVGGRVVVVGGGVVVVVVLRIGASSGGALAGDVATGGLLSVASSAPGGRDGIGVHDDVLLRRNGGEAVMVLPTTLVVVVIPFAVAVGTVMVPFTCWTESVGGVWVLGKAKAHTAPLTARTATTSATPGIPDPISIVRTESHLSTSPWNVIPLKHAPGAGERLVGTSHLSGLPRPIVFAASTLLGQLGRH